MKPSHAPGIVLVLTNSADATADYLLDRCARRGAQFFRVDTDRLVANARVSYDADGPLMELHHARVRPQNVAAIWLRRPHPLSVPPAYDPAEEEHVREEWSEAAEGFFAHVDGHRWMNHPSNNARASHKLSQLTVAQRCGLAIPETLVTQDPQAFRHFWRTHDGGIIVKPLASGTVERDQSSDDTHIYTSPVSVDMLDRCDLVTQCPTLVQERIRKRKDVRVCSVDSSLIAVAMTGVDAQGEQRLDIRIHNMLGVRYERVDMPFEVAEGVRRLVVTYGLRFAALDFAIDENGRWIFFEVNPNGQWAWLDQMAQTNITDAIIDALRGEPPQS
jgi:MvdD-like protein with pre-ATP grasp domain/glutathione synthetase-like protein